MSKGNRNNNQSNTPVNKSDKTESVQDTPNQNPEASTESQVNDDPNSNVVEGIANGNNEAAKVDAENTVAANNVTVVDHEPSVEADISQEEADLHRHVFYGVEVSVDASPLFDYLEDYKKVMDPKNALPMQSIFTKQHGLYDAVHGILGRASVEKFNYNLTALLRYFSQSSDPTSALYEGNIHRGYENLPMEKERREAYLDLITALISLSDENPDVRKTMSRGIDMSKVTRILPEERQQMFARYFE